MGGRAAYELLRGGCLGVLLGICLAACLSGSRFRRLAVLVSVARLRLLWRVAEAGCDRQSQGSNQREYCSSCELHSFVLLWRRRPLGVNIPAGLSFAKIIVQRRCWNFFVI